MQEIVKEPCTLLVGSRETFVIRPWEASIAIIGPSERLTVGSTQREFILVGPALWEELATVGPTSPIRIEPPQRGLWEDQGWMLRMENRRRVYEGHYKVRDRLDEQVRRYRGRVVEEQSEAVPYIENPPPEIKQHPKGVCFQLYREPWFKVHWSRPARNADDAILYVQRVLYEALSRR